MALPTGPLPSTDSTNNRWKTAIKNSIFHPWSRMQKYCFDLWLVEWQTPRAEGRAKSYKQIFGCVEISTLNPTSFKGSRQSGLRGARGGLPLASPASRPTLVHLRPPLPALAARVVHPLRLSLADTRVALLFLSWDVSGSLGDLPHFGNILAAWARCLLGPVR